MASLATALLRAAVFAGGFFGIIAGIYFLYGKFLRPDGEVKDAGPTLGKNVDYSVDDIGDWLDMRKSANESLPAEAASGMADDSALGPDAGPIDFESLSGLPVGSETNDEAHAVPPDTGSEALEQSGDNVYSKDGALAPSEKPSAGYAFDMDMSDFTPAAPMFNGGEYSAAKAVPSSAEVWEPAEPGAGVVDMSLARKSGAKADLIFDGDGKKMAGAIRTLLKKDEG
ncbi:MAG: hypothetical protein LBH50_02815 [Spirochaetaceae bacterium]|jgi:hypothetical protein|nr:hypothetical protein [Spirochaetaceae bacterium]